MAPRVLGSSPATMANAQDTFVNDPVGFWDERHQAFDPWRSGGDRGLTLEENREFYALRLAQLIRLIRRHRGPDRGMRIMDAGCGRGHLTHALREAGHDAHGVDSSPSAIEEAARAYGGSFEVRDLSALRPGMPYEVVICMDVLFHVLDDAMWKASLVGMTRLCAAESLFIVADRFGEARVQIHDYIVHRSSAEYDEALAVLGFQRVELMRYAFGANPNAFAAYTRSL